MKAGHLLKPVKLDEWGSKLVIFNTPVGHCEFKLMPFGISSAPKVFQRVIWQIFEGLGGAEVIADDILIWAVEPQGTSRKAEATSAGKREEESPICIFKKFKCHGYIWPQVNHVSRGVLQNKCQLADETTFKTISTPRPRCFKSAVSKSGTGGFWKGALHLLPK